LVKKIYPNQGVVGDYYNVLNGNNQDQLKAEIDPTFKYLIAYQIQFPLEQVIILDGKNELRPFSAINIKTSKGNYLKKLQTNDNNDNVDNILELSIP
jgi:hypothetical protein